MPRSVSKSYKTEYFRLFDSQRLAYPRGDAVLRFLREGWFEYGEMAAFARMLRPGDQFIDIGAHCGLYSAIASNLMGPEARIIAVEPNTRVHSYLLANMQPEWTVDTYPESVAGRGVIRAAMGAEDGEAELNVGDDEHSAYSSIISPPSEPSSDKDADEQTTITVPVIMLRPLLEKVSDNELVFVKLDVEGLEFDLLQPAAEYLKTQNNIHFQIEFDENNASAAGHDTAELADLITGLGFDFHTFDTVSQRLVPFAEKFPVWNTNLIATKRPDVLVQRLAGAAVDTMEMTNDLLAMGQVCNQAYLMREEAMHLKGELVTTAKTAKKMHADLESRSLNAAEEQKYHAALERADNRDLAELIHEALGQLGGAARSVSTQLHEANNQTNRRLEEARLMKTKLSSIVQFAAKLHTTIEGKPVDDNEVRQLGVKLKEADYRNLTKSAQDSLERLGGAALSICQQLDEARKRLLTLRAFEPELDEARKELLTLRSLEPELDEARKELLTLRVLKPELDEARKELLTLRALEPELDEAIRKRAETEALLSAQNHAMAKISTELDKVRNIIASMLFGKDNPAAVDNANLHSIKADLNHIRDNIAELSLEALPYPKHHENRPENERDLETTNRHLCYLKTQFIAIHRMISDLEQSKWLSLGQHLGVTAAERVRTIAEYVEQLSTETNELNGNDGEDSSKNEPVS